MTTETGLKLVMCVPKKVIPEILMSLHDDPVSGHLGVNKTIAKARSKLYGPTLNHDVKAYVLSCRDCQGRKGENQLTPGLMVPIKVGVPFEIIGIDLLGPFPLSVQGNKQIIVATDYLIRYAGCKPISNNSSVEVAKFPAEQMNC